MIAAGAAVAAVGMAAYRLWRSVSLDMLSNEAITFARMASLSYRATMTPLVEPWWSYLPHVLSIRTQS